MKPISLKRLLASNAKVRRVLIGLPLLSLLAWICLKNFGYVQAGLFNPNFNVIFEFYQFNLIYLPIGLFLLGIAYALLIFSLPKHRVSLVFLSLGLIGLTLFLIGFRIYITEVEPKKLLVQRVTQYSKKLTQPLRIVHFSDIQSAGIGSYEARIFKTIQSLQPDLVLYTGDFLQLPKSVDFNREWDKLLTHFKALKPRFGIYAVYGDTELELYSKPRSEIAPIQLLSSRSDRFTFEGGDLSIYGLSLYNSKNPLWAMRGIESWLADETDSSFKIIIGHAPDYALALKDSPVDLCLAGHTHGGQVRLPFIGPLIIDSAVPKSWALGYNKIGIPHLNVSAGAGSNRYNGLPALRFNCPTELTLIEILPDES